jgi:hypothetical protein
MPDETPKPAEVLKSALEERVEKLEKAFKETRAIVHSLAGHPHPKD